MLRNLPTAYRTDPWILAMCGAVQILLEELGRETAELPVQIRLSELTWQLPVEERLAGLSPRPGASLEDRRSAVIAKWRSGGARPRRRRTPGETAWWMWGSTAAPSR